MATASTASDSCLAWQGKARLAPASAPLAVLAAVAFLPRLLRSFKSAEEVRWIEVAELAPRLDGTKAIAVINVRRPDEVRLPHIVEFRDVTKTYNAGQPNAFTAVCDVTFVVQDLVGKGEFV